MSADSEKGERIAKRIARAGVASRRDAERLIAEGRVSVDGAILASPARNVTADNVILVDSKPLPDAEATRLWLYHKPKGQIVSHRDPQGRATVFQALPKELGRVLSIGRLDYNSEGLLLLTNDGALARRLELPSTGWLRRYRVRVHGTPDPKTLARLAAGVSVDGVDYGPIKAEIDTTKGANCWLTIGLREGKNREVRKVFEHFGHTVSRLIRVAYGPFQLGVLTEGEVREVTGKVLKEQLGHSGEKRADRRRPAARPQA